MVKGETEKEGIRYREGVGGETTSIVGCFEKKVGAREMRTYVRLNIRLIPIFMRITLERVAFSFSNPPRFHNATVMNLTCTNDARI